MLFRSHGRCKISDVQIPDGIEQFIDLVNKAYEPIEDHRVGKVMDDFLKSKSNNSKNSERIVDIICGSCFNYARASSGRLYSWGLGESGELGRIVGDVKNKEQEYNKDIKSQLK